VAVLITLHTFPLGLGSLLDFYWVIGEAWKEREKRVIIRLGQLVFPKSTCHFWRVMRGHYSPDFVELGVVPREPVGG